MTDYIGIAAIITSLATLVAAIGTFVISFVSARKIEEVRHATNSLTDRLVETTKTESFAAGKKEGREEHQHTTEK